MISAVTSVIGPEILARTAAKSIIWTAAEDFCLTLSSGPAGLGGALILQEIHHQAQKIIQTLQVCLLLLLWINTPELSLCVKMFGCKLLLLCIITY